ESIWDHPCDEQFRKLYAKEKEKLKNNGVETKKSPENVGKDQPILKPIVTPQASKLGPITKSKSISNPQVGIKPELKPSPLGKTPAITTTADLNSESESESIQIDSSEDSGNSNSSNPSHLRKDLSPFGRPMNTDELKERVIRAVNDDDFDVSDRESENSNSDGCNNSIPRQSATISSPNVSSRVPVPVITITSNSQSGTLESIATKDLESKRKELDNIDKDEKRRHELDVQKITSKWASETAAAEAIAKANYEKDASNIATKYARSLKEIQEKELADFNAKIKTFKDDLDKKINNAQKDMQDKELSSIKQKLESDKVTEIEKLKKEIEEIKSKHAQKIALFKEEIENQEQKEIEEIKNQSKNKIIAIQKQESEKIELKLIEWREMVRRQNSDSQDKELKIIREEKEKVLKELETSLQMRIKDVEKAQDEEIQKVQETGVKNSEIRRSEIEDSLKIELIRLKEEGHERMERIRKDLARKEASLKEEETNLLKSYQAQQEEHKSKLRVLDESLSKKQKELQEIEIELSSKKYTTLSNENDVEVDIHRKVFQIDTQEKESEERSLRLQKEKDRLDAWERSMELEQIGLKNKEQENLDLLSREVAKKQKIITDQKVSLEKEQLNVEVLRSRLADEHLSLKKLENELSQKHAWLKENLDKQNNSNAIPVKERSFTENENHGASRNFDDTANPKITKTDFSKEKNLEIDEKISRRKKKDYCLNFLSSDNS
ncbi:hypothetical protein HK096_006438, partial [Nowakowskiella sp. JEL0078]